MGGGGVLGWEVIGGGVDLSSCSWDLVGIIDLRWNNDTPNHPRRGTRFYPQIQNNHRHDREPNEESDGLTTKHGRYPW